MTFIKKLLCGFNPIGAFAELVAGKAKECWCCSFWRGVLFGAVVGSGFTYTVLTLIK